MKSKLISFFKYYLLNYCEIIEENFSVRKENENHQDKYERLAQFFRLDTFVIILF